MAERTASAARAGPPAKKSVFARLGGADPPRPKRLTPHGDGDREGSPPLPARRGSGTVVRHMSALSMRDQQVTARAAHLRANASLCAWETSEHSCPSPSLRVQNRA